MAVTLKVVQGKPNGSYLHFPDGEFIIGRGPECHVRPNSERISRQHCLLCVRGDRIVIRDLGSANGTFVNGGRVQECALGIGGTLQISPLVLEVVLVEPKDGPGGARCGCWPRWPPGFLGIAIDPGIPIGELGLYPANPADTPIPGSLWAG
jgi:hypothetical protein